MVHLFCHNSDCRTIIHLDDETHWNYKGKVKCQKCGTTIEIEIRNGQVISVKNSQIGCMPASDKKTEDNA